MMSLKARLICFLLGLVVLAVISFLIRRRRLYNIYAITWFLVGLGFIAMGAIDGFVEMFALVLGISFPSTAVMVVAIGGVMAIVLHLTMIVTEQHKQIRQFEKEIALMRVKNGNK